jgi:hypothetical protein
MIRGDFRGGTRSRGRAGTSTGSFLPRCPKPAPQAARRLTQVARQPPEIRLSSVAVRYPQARRRVDGDVGADALRREERLPALVADGDAAPEHRTRRRHTQADQGRRPDEPQLLLEPGVARLHFLLARTLVNAPFSSRVRLPFEMLDRVRDVDPSAVEPARARAWSSRRPAGPTNGRPARSSSCPGCSPTITMDARPGPSPKTVWVARL